MSKLAQAYAMKRRMAKGGMVDDEDKPVADYADVQLMDPKLDELDNPYAEGMKEKSMSGAYAKGGMVDRIMAKRMSEGGMVANDDMPEADFKKADFDDLSLRDDLEYEYTGANSGDELGDKGEDERRSDIVSRIMKSRSKKDRNPNPA